MGTQCLNINCTSCIVGTVSVKEVTLLTSGYIYAGLLNWFLRLCEVKCVNVIIDNGYLCLPWSVQANCTNVAAARLMSKLLTMNSG